MTPSIEIRLTSVIHGLRDVVFPALDPQESLAQEQSGLILIGPRCFSEAPAQRLQAGKPTQPVRQGRVDRVVHA